MSEYTQLRNNRIRKARKALYFLEGIRWAKALPLLDTLFATADKDTDLGLQSGLYWPAKKRLPPVNARDTCDVLLTAMPSINAEKLQAGGVFRSAQDGGHFWKSASRKDKKLVGDLLHERLLNQLRLYGGRCPDIVTGGLPLAGPEGTGLAEKEASANCLFDALSRYGDPDPRQTVFVEWKAGAWKDRATFTYGDSFCNVCAFPYNTRNRIAATLYSRAVYFLHADGTVPWDLPVGIDRWDIVHPALLEIFRPGPDRHPYIEVQVHGGLVADDVHAYHTPSAARERLLSSIPA